MRNPKYPSPTPLPVSPRRPRRAPSAALARIVACVALAACGSLITDAPDGGDLLDAPVDGLSDAEAAAFARGDAEFDRRFAPASGLGPIFNNVSCAACHSGDGRGQLRNALHRFGSADNDFLRTLGGPQLQDRATSGAEPERLPEGVPVSVRLPPPVFGVGLIEAIPDETLLALADPDDADGDGISGRPNYVVSADYVPHTEPGHATSLVIGRFGRKAQTATLLEQVVEAYHQDIGITSDFRLVENRNPLSSVPVEAADRAGDPEIPVGTVQAVVHYIRALAPPRPGSESAERQRGGEIFASIGCARCHVPVLQTGTSPVPALAHRPAALYSDLLLHDMGDALADRRPDGDATGREWRTTPLWGLRLMRQFLDGDALLMHDGRARSVEAAILLHGGESARARDAFIALPPASRSALLDFVESR
ncbi:MAG TPA: di-heme oxidoredictase family protein [Gemmatimonadaceae bacterium]|nr:di-heme oxidoredictase family protein [Gemmatimonadaceae bacterium]